MQPRRSRYTNPSWEHAPSQGGRDGVSYRTRPDSPRSITCWFHPVNRSRASRHPAQHSSHILRGFFQLYPILRSPMTSTSSPLSLSQLTIYQSPQSLRVICYFSTEFTLLLSLISLHRPSSFLKNYLLILCQWDPFPPVS